MYAFRKEPGLDTAYLFRPQKMMYFSMLIRASALVLSHLSGEYVPTPSVYHTPAILQTLNMFSHAVDSQDFDLLYQHFTLDAYCNFNDYKGILHGLDNITANLRDGLNGKRTHHSLSTQIVVMTGPDTASAISYLEGIFFFPTGRYSTMTTYGRSVCPHT